MPRDLANLRESIRARSPLPPDRTEAILAHRFSTFPRRLAFALERWPLDSSAVLDVGCAYGHCLAHFGPGSMGVDIVPEHVDFCRAIGLDARLADVDVGLGEIPERAFDFAWVSDVVEHLDAPRLVLRRIAPKLRPDGRLIVFLTTVPRNRLVRAFLRRRGLAPFDAWAHHYQFSYDTARFLLERSGFRVEEIAVPIPTKSRLIGAAGRLATAQAPRLFLVGRPDPEAEARAREAEARNKPGRGAD